MTYRGSQTGKQPLSVLLVEGQTEEVFYRRVKDTFLRDLRVTIELLEGLRNINEKVLNRLIHKYSDQDVRAYCCVDRESRYGNSPDLKISWIQHELLTEGMVNVKSIHAITATQMIESWFFHDVEGIFRFLEVRKSQRNPRRFRPPDKFGKVDLKKLFHQHGKEYREGERARSLIEALDIELIADSCYELRNGIKLIRQQASS